MPRVLYHLVYNKGDRLDNVDISVTSKQSDGLKKAGKSVACCSMKQDKNFLPE